MPNNLFVTAIIYGAPDSDAISLSLSAIVRSDLETAVAHNVATFISQNPGWRVNLVQSVALPLDFLQNSLAEIAKEGPSEQPGATVLRLVPEVSKRRGRPRKQDARAELAAEAVAAAREARLAASQAMPPIPDDDDGFCPSEPAA